MGLHVGKEALRRTLGEDHGLATEGTHLRPADVEGIAVACQPRQIDVAALGHQSVAQSRPVDEEPKPIVTANVVDGLQSGLVV